MSNQLQGAEGVRFSLNYLSRGEPTRDSMRMRRRLLSAATDHTSGELASKIQAELGVTVPHTGTGYFWSQYYETCELRDLLDTVTIIAVDLAQYSLTRDKWVAKIARIFREENVGYRVDTRGGVHFAVDDEFERNWASSIGALASSKFSAAREHFEAAHKALDAHPIRTREAIRQTFEGVETVFRLLLPDAKLLGSSEVEKRLRPMVLDRYEGNARNAASKQVGALKEWVEGAHPYRHGQGVEETDNPPLDVAVLMVSAGAGFVRWLAQLVAAKDTLGVPGGAV